LTRKAVKAGLAGLAFLILGIWLFGAREPVRLTISLDRSEAQNQMQKAGLDAYLAAREGRFDDIIDGVEKQIIWAGEAGRSHPSDRRSGGLLLGAGPARHRARVGEH